MRKLSKTLAMMSLLAPMGASALGIGDIRLRSALNQSLNAEIPLVLSGGDSLADVKISLASPEAFAKAGLERHYFLTKLRFSAVQKPDGSYAIEVSSSDVMREPFVSFLVEVNWPRGRVIREYTVLLDPPATFSDRALVDSSAPSVSEQPSEDVAHTAEAPVAPAAPRELQPRPSTVKASSGSEGAISGTEYGPVEKDSTLWEIAKRVNRDPDVTQEQMVIALYRNNPHAFYGNSPDTLKAGETLKIPEREYILKISRSQARNELQQATAARSGKLASRSSQPQSLDTAPGAEASKQAQLKLLAPSDTKTKDEEAVVGASGGTGKSKGEVALEVVETLKQENEDLRSRLADLEQQLAETRRLLTLKNEQIALLQEPQAQQPSAEAATKEAIDPEQAIEQTIQEQEALTQAQTPTQLENPQPKQAADQDESAPPPPPAVVKPEQPKAAAPKSVPAPPPEEKSVWDELFEHPTYLGVGAGGLMLLAVIPWLLARRRAAMIEETESILIATEKENLQKARATDSNFDTMISESAPPTKTSFLSEFTPSDFDALGAEADEVDPISEADVYLAYGRYKQAEDLIRNAIEQYPERDECKLKLLEIHYATENRKAFESFAQELKDQGKDSDPDFWENVVEMGRELCPTHPLFSASLSSSRSFALDSKPGDLLAPIDITDELIEDLKRFDNEVAETSGSTEEQRIPVDFSLDGPIPAELPEMEAEHADLEFKVDGLSIEKTAVVEQQADDGFPELDNLIAFDTGKSESKSRKEHSIKPAAEAKGEEVPADGNAAHELGDQMFDFDFGSFGLENSQPNATEAEGQSPESADLSVFAADTFDSHFENEARKDSSDQSIDDLLRELDKKNVLRDDTPNSARLTADSNAETPTFDFKIDLPSSVEADAADINVEGLEGLSVEDERNEYAPLTDMDQLDTKLDLAKAYADMEDKQSALEMLKEVLEMGNEGQKMEARSLMDKLEMRTVQSEPISLASRRHRN